VSDAGTVQDQGIGAGVSARSKSGRNGRLEAVPRLEIDPSRLRPLSRRALDELLRSPSVDAEWPEVKASLDRVMVIEDGKTGGVNVGDRRALYYLVRALRPRRVLEIGTDVGASTMSIAAAMKRNGAAPGEGAFITVDIEDIEGAERKLASRRAAALAARQPDAARRSRQCPVCRLPGDFTRARPRGASGARYVAAGTRLT
jgi:hypothetical protein